MHSRCRVDRVGSLSTLRCIRSVHTVQCLQCDSLQAATFHTVGSSSGSLWVGPLSKSAPPRPKAGPGFSPAPLPRTASRPVNHSSRPHCSAWPAGTLAMATQIPADLAVKNRSSQKYERQESLIQRARMGFTPESKMSRSHDWRLLKCYFSYFISVKICLCSFTKKQFVLWNGVFLYATAGRKVCITKIHNWTCTTEAARNTGESSVWAL